MSNKYLLYMAKVDGFVSSRPKDIYISAKKLCQILDIPQNYDRTVTRRMLTHPNVERFSQRNFLIRAVI